MISPLAKLSPYTLSLIGSSPRSLPHVPTLRELRELNGSIPLPTSISNSSDQLQSPNSDSERVKSKDGGGYDSGLQSQARPQARVPVYHYSPPPAYDGPSRLAWIDSSRQTGIPGEGRPVPGMRGSMPYSGDEKGELPIRVIPTD